MKVCNVPHIIPASTVLNTTVNSQPQQLYQSFGYSIQVFFTGTPTGSFKLQGSDDPAYSGLVGGNTAGVPTRWSDIAGSSTAVSAAGDVFWDKISPMYNWVRVQYTDGSVGTSTAIVTYASFNSKGF